MTISLETALKAAGLKPEENAYEKKDADEERANINGEQSQLGPLSYRQAAPFGNDGTAEFCHTSKWVDANNSDLPMLIGELQALQRDADALTARLLQAGVFVQRRLVTPEEVVDGARGFEYRFKTRAAEQGELNKFVATLAQYARETEGRE